MLHHHIAEAEVLGQIGQQLAECLKAAGRGADTNNKRSFFGFGRIGGACRFFAPRKTHLPG